MLLSIEKTGTNKMKQGQESVGDATMLSHCYLLRNPWPKLTGVLEHCRKGEIKDGSPFFGTFLCDDIPQRRRMTMFISLHSLNRASWYTYVRKTNKKHLYLNHLFQLNYFLHVSNKQVHHQEVISVLASHSVSHLCIYGCLVANTIRLEPVVSCSQ